MSTVRALSKNIVNRRGVVPLANVQRLISLAQTSKNAMNAASQALQMAKERHLATRRLAAIVSEGKLSIAFSGRDPVLFEPPEIMEEVRALIFRDRADVNAVVATGMPRGLSGPKRIMLPLLSLAVIGGNYGIVGCLLKAGVDVGSKGTGPPGMSAFEWLFSSSSATPDPRIIRELLRAGATIPRSLAGKIWVNWDVYGAGSTLLDPDTLELLIKGGLDVRGYLPDYDTTPIFLIMEMAAAANIPAPQLARLISVLVKGGANVNKGRSEGGSPLLTFAVEYTDDVRIVDALLQAGARVDAKDRQGRLAITFARDLGKTEMYERLKLAHQLARSRPRQRSPVVTRSRR